MCVCVCVCGWVIGYAAIAKTSDLLSLELPIVYREPPDFFLLRERSAIKHVFDSEHRTVGGARVDFMYNLSLTLLLFCSGLRRESK